MTASRLLSLALALSLAGVTASAESRAIGWADLAAPAAEYDNPFAELSREQMLGLRDLLWLQTRIEGGEAALAADAAALRARLEGEGLDIDWLFEKRLEIMEKRRLAATSVNEGVIGQSVRIPGYLLPLEVRDRRAIEFLLVPTVGACIHTPPPQANQMVHVRYPEGFEITGLYDPIWIEGSLAAQSSVQEVSYVDGETAVSVSYAMDAVTVEPYRAE